MVEIVIKLSDRALEFIKESGIKDIYGIEEAICNGVVLPKGHGRLIDVKDLLTVICLEDNDENRDCNLGEIITLEDVDRIPTLIEADEEEMYADNIEE